VLELKHLTWMQQQWRRFRRLVLGATGAIWVLCCSGVLLLPAEDLIPRIALLLMLLSCTGVSIYLMLVARREIKDLGRQVIEARAKELEELADKAGPAKRK
jgi:hypothetical protein